MIESDRITQLNVRAKKTGAKLSILSIERKLGREFAVCKCICGKIHKVRLDNVVRGRTKSCGCIASVKRIGWTNRG